LFSATQDSSAVSIPLAVAESISLSTSTAMRPLRRMPWARPMAITRAFRM
jgi:hypothetical protein